MKTTRGARNGWKHMAEQLKLFYGRWAGELAWIENPPKSMGRKWRGRDEFAAAAAEREQRAEAIREALPHILYVIQLVDPAWRAEMAKLVRPHRQREPAPPVGWPEATMMVLRGATDYMQVTQIVDEIANTYDEVDLTPVGARTKAALAVSGSLLRTYRHLLIEDPEGGGWALTSRVPSFSN